MKAKMLIRACLIVLPVVLVMASVNYTVDPAQVFDDGFIQEVARGVLEGSNVALTADNYNERRLQRLIISGLAEPPDGIALGSSRIFSIPCDAFGFEKGVNNGVSGAVMEDMLSMAELYDEYGMLPQTVVMGIDPWLFNANHGDTRYKELIPEYNRFAKKLQLPAREEMGNIYTGQLFSPTYFQSAAGQIFHSPRSVMQAFQNMKNKPKPIISRDISSDYTNKLSDGSIFYKKEIRSQSEEKVSQSVTETIAAGHFYHSVHYSCLSPEIIDQLTKLVDFFKSNDITVKFVLSPLHPAFYEHIEQNEEYRMLLEAEPFILDFASERGIQVIGSYDPAKVGAENTDFLDFAHPTREFMILLCESAG